MFAIVYSLSLWGFEKVRDPEVCDATTVESSTTAGYKIFETENINDRKQGESFFTFISSVEAEQ